jgi:phthalate 4,5-cis-dihydrodiol dehydrogenase
MFKLLSRGKRDVATPRTALRKPLTVGIASAPVAGSPHLDDPSRLRNLVFRPLADWTPLKVAPAEGAGIDAIYLTAAQPDLAGVTRAAAAAGKHVLLEVSSQLDMRLLDEMLETCTHAGVQMLAAHQHNFDAIYLETRSLIDSGIVGPVNLILGFSYSDDTPAQGASVCRVDQLHVQVDLVRLLAGSSVTRARLIAPSTATAAGRQSHVTQFWFHSGAIASMTYGGTGRFNSDDWCGSRNRQGLPPAEASEIFFLPFAHRHAGPLLIGCEGGDLRPMSDGIRVYGDKGRCRVLPVRGADHSPMVAMALELERYLSEGRPPLFDGAWARDTLSVCAALRRSRDDDTEVWLPDASADSSRLSVVHDETTAASPRGRASH